MSPPIREGSGNSIGSIRLGDGSEISEVRTGAGDVLFSASAIPDSVVDNFEDADADPPGVYESGDTVATYYSGDTGAFSRSATGVIENSYGLQNDDTDDVYIVSEPGDGLNKYPETGATVGWFAQSFGDAQNTHFPVTVFNGAYDGSVDGYGFMTASYDGGYLKIVRIDNGSDTDLQTSSPSLSDGVWYWAEADLPPTSGTSEGDIDFRLYNLNGDLSRGSQIDSLSATDTNYGDNRGVGFGSTISGYTGETLWDYVRVL